MTYDAVTRFNGRHLIYPNSISMDNNGTVYVSARYATAVYRNIPHDFAPTWLVPKSCVRFIPDKNKIDCKCVAQ